MRRALPAALATLVLLLGIPVPSALGASAAKVVIVVGPVGPLNAHYKRDAEEIATEARRWTPNVVRLTTPTATWARVKAAMQGASVFVYLGHGNGWPSPYPPFQVLTKDGLGLDPATGADGTKTVYYGEEYLRNDVRLAPNAVVLLYHLCYASGNTEPGHPQGTFADARQRVDNYGAGFIGAGARAVFAEGHPAHPVVSQVRQLFSTNRTMDQVFRASPAAHGNVVGPYASQRTPGLGFVLDPEAATPSGFYRSLIGDLALRASDVVRTPPAGTGTVPATLVVPGAAEVSASAGTGLFKTAAAAADHAAKPGSVLADRTRLRITAEAEPAADGSRILAVTVMGTSTKGFARAAALVPRDSANVDVWTLDQSAGQLSPNGDGSNDALVVAARLSERAATTFVVKNAAGTKVKSMSLDNEIVRFAWDLKAASGSPVADGTYGWTLRATDPWGNGTVVRTGSFTVDAKPPVTTATTVATAGGGGWLVKPPTITLKAKDATSGVRLLQWRLDGGAVATYAAPVEVTANGAHTFEYRALDRAGIREGWKSLALRIDTKGPAIALPLAGKAGAAAGTWRGPVTIAPSVKDAASGLQWKRVSVDGAPAVELGSAPVTVSGDGEHTVHVTARDKAGNGAQAKVTLTIDTTAPAVELPAPPATPPTVSPNGDGIGERIALPFAISEPGSVTATITDGAAAVVRTIVLGDIAREGSVEWDGRTAAGAPVPDGRYTVAFTPTDRAGNVGSAATAEVDVYAALQGLARTPARFFPQDGDALARQAGTSFTLRKPATVSISVLDATGAVVRTAVKAKAYPAGQASWAWAGRIDGGGWAPRGTYRIVVTATNGTQAASQSVTVLADAFRLTTSTPTAARGTAIVLTVASTEPLAAAPRLVVTQTGLPAWTVPMTRAGSTWTARVVPKKAGQAGTLVFGLRATDTAGGVNQGSLRVPLE